MHSRKSFQNHCLNFSSIIRRGLYYGNAQPIESLTAATMLWGPIHVRLNIGKKAPFSTANLKKKKFIKNSNQSTESTHTYILVQWIDHTCISEAFIWLIYNTKFHIFTVLFLAFLFTKLCECMENLLLVVGSIYYTDAGIVSHNGQQLSTCWERDILNPSTWKL